MINTYYILAANAKHAHYCAISYGLNPRNGNVRYVSRPEQLWGIQLSENVHLIFYETWREHPKAQELAEQVLLLERKRDLRSTPVEEKMPEQNGLFTKTFWKRTGERVISTFAQALLGAIVAVTPVEHHFDWSVNLQVAGYAALASLLKNVVGSKIGNTSSDPSWVPTTKEDKNVDKNSTKS